MKEYLIILIGTSLSISLFSLLIPDGATSKYVRLLSALFLVCVIISPINGLIDGIRAFASGELPIPEWEGATDTDPDKELQTALDNASKSYFLQSLTQMLEQEFSIHAGEISCNAVWQANADGQIKPTEIHILLYGSAIWKDPKKIESYINDLLGCKCIIAVD